MLHVDISIFLMKENILSGKEQRQRVFGDEGWKKLQGEE